MRSLRDAYLIWNLALIVTRHSYLSRKNDITFALQYGVESKGIFLGRENLVTWNRWIARGLFRLSLRLSLRKLMIKDWSLLPETSSRKLKVHKRLTSLVIQWLIMNGYLRERERENKGREFHPAIFNYWYKFKYRLLPPDYLVSLYRDRDHRKKSILIKHTRGVWRTN